MSRTIIESAGVCRVSGPPPAAARPRVVYLAHRVPYPPDRGDRIRTYHTLRSLSRRASVHLACLADEAPHDGAVEALLGLCDRVAIVPAAGGGRWRRALASLALGGTVTEGAFDSPALHALLGRWASEMTFDAALVSASGMVPYLRRPAIRDVPALVDLVDVDSQKWLDYAAASRGPR